MVLNYTIRKLIVSAAFLLAIASNSHAQKTVCIDVIKKHNKSVITALYLMYGNKSADINCEGQLKLADAIQERDSIMAANIAGNSSAQILQSLLLKIQKKIDNLCAELKTETSFQQQNKKIVDAEIKFFQKTYGIRKEDSLQLQPLLTAKYTFFNKAVSQLREGKLFEGELAQQLSYNWHMIKTAYNAEATKYFDEQVQKLNAVKQMPTADFKKINDRYYELLRITTSFSNKDRFDMAFRQNNTDTIYYRILYPQQISDIAIPLTVAERRRVLQYNPSPVCMDSLNKIFRNKSRHIAAVILAFNGRYGRSDTLIRQTAAPYDSLIYVQLLKDGAYINSGVINAAVKYRVPLKLRNTQTDSLIERGMFLNKIKDSVWNINPLAPYDAKDFENIWLSKILEEEQLFFLLGKKYLKDAQINAANDWTDLEKRGLAKNMKQNEVIAELTLYYIKVKASSTMYAYDIDKQAAYGRSAREAMPQALRTLQYARKNNITTTENKTEIKQ
jgi:hypothetical protein